MNAHLLETNKLLAGLSEQLDELIKLTNDQIPKGIFQSLTLPITTEPTIIDINNSYGLTLPLRQFDLINDGSGNILVSLYNNKGEGIGNTNTPVNSGERISVDYKIRNIAMIKIVTVSGSANVRMFAIQ